MLYLKLLYSRVPNCSIRRSVWDNLPITSQKSGLRSQLGLTGNAGSQQQAVLVMCISIVDVVCEMIWFLGIRNNVQNRLTENSIEVNM